MEIIVELQFTQCMTMDSINRATLFFSALLLLFIQTLTVWLESIYKIGLTRLSMGREAAGLLFVLAPLLVLLCPARGQRKLLWGSVTLFLVGRSVIPTVGVAAGHLIGGATVAAFLVALCLVLSRRFQFLQGNTGIALGLALLASIALRAWGATEDSTLSRSGAVLGWVITGLALGLFWSLLSGDNADSCEEPPPARPVVGPVLGLFANLTVVYLVLSSPGVVEAWLGFDNTHGSLLCILSLGGALILLGQGWRISRVGLALWNLLFGIAVVGGLLALRITFPETAASPAVVVRPENTVARLLLNLMFLLSPVVLFNVQAASQSVGEAVRTRSLAGPVFMGITLLVFLTLMSIFTNVWGYVGPVSAVFRNQFHLPFLLITAVMTGALFLPGWRAAFPREPARPAERPLAAVAMMLVVAALAGTWHYRPVAAEAAGNQKQLTLLSYNLQQGAALSGNRNWENQLALIRAINADIVGLQESDTPRPSNGNVAAAKFFGAKLGYHIYYGPNTVSGTYGTAVLSRFPLKNPRTFFTFSDEDEVGTAVVEFEVDGKTIAFFNSHPSGNIPRKRHAEELVRRAMPYDYVIAVGDYNTTPQEEPYRTVTAQLKDSWREKYPDGVGRLHPVLRPRGVIRPHGSSGEIPPSGDMIAMPDRIDHIFVSKRFRVIESYYLPAPDSQTDHPAHWTVVEWD